MSDHIDLEDIFKIHYTPLFCFARQILDEDQDCHDIVSEVFEELWYRRDNIRSATVKSYLYACVRNKCLSALRQKNIHQRYIDYCGQVTVPYTNEDELKERVRRERAMIEVLTEMGPPIGEVARQHFLHGKKYQQIADELGLGLSLVKKYMVRAMATMKTEVQKKLKTITF